jgi:hypothetical protein
MARRDSPTGYDWKSILSLPEATRVQLRRQSNILLKCLRELVFERMP